MARWCHDFRRTLQCSFSDEHRLKFENDLRFFPAIAHELFPDVGMILEVKDQNCFEISNRHAIGLSSFSENKEGKSGVFWIRTLRGSRWYRRICPGLSTMLMETSYVKFSAPFRLLLLFFISRAEKNLVVDLRWFQVFLPEADMKKSYLWSLTNYFVFKWKHISAQSVLQGLALKRKGK